MRFRFALIIILLIALAVPVNARAAEEKLPTFKQGEIVPGELIVIMQAGKKTRNLPLPEKAKISSKKHQGLEKLDAGVVIVPVGEESAYIAKIKKQKDVLTVEPNYVVQAEMAPDDTLYPMQYGLALIQAETAWDITTGSSGVTIAIIDSGLDTLHPEFAGRIVSPYDFISNDFTPQDDCGHGTHVTGIAAAAGNNGQGIAGIAWGVQIMPLRVLDEGCGGSFADIADALVWAADHGADVINLSVGGPSPSTLMENATHYAYSHGAAIFAASGNSGGAVLYPAAYPWVMAIGSVDGTPARVSSSNQGAALDLMAPGASIYSTLPTEPGFYYNTVGYPTDYGFLSGTSMASPHAAGAAALLLSMPGSCFSTPDQIYQALIASALDLGAAGFDNLHGYGLIQIELALAECPAAPPPPALSSVQYDFAASAACGGLVQYNWRNTTTGVTSPGDSNYRSIALPFNFDYAGVSYASVNAHANGFISLGNNNTNIFTERNYENNFILPGSALPNNFLAPFWDDLSDVTGAGIYTAVNGVAPNREFVIEYRNFQRMQPNPAPPPTRIAVPGTVLNFQVVLFESTNEILFQYKTLRGAGANGSSATVGLEYANGFGATEYSYNTASLQPGLALLFVPYVTGTPALPANVCPRTESVTIPAGKASACDTSPTTFDVEIAEGILPHDASLRIQQLDSAPAMPQSFLDLHHYADIRLNYPPPATLTPTPPVIVCYEYIGKDVLAAGGHPENLFIAARDHVTGVWSALPTTVDYPNARLLALAPHFSYYGVATLNPQRSAKENELGLPVTGAPFGKEMIFTAIFFILFIFLSRKIWLRNAK